MATARRLHAALQAGRHGDELRELFTVDATTIERPNAVKPRGASTQLEEMLVASSTGAGLLTDQRYDLVDAIEVGEVAVLRLIWTAGVAKDLGPFHQGQVLTAYIAQFVTVRNGQIASIETYDCYEPFT